MSQQTRTIVIVCRGSNDFDVHEGEGAATRLTWDEMLGHVAEATHPRIARGRFLRDADDILRSLEQWAGIANRDRATSCPGDA